MACHGITSNQTSAFAGIAIKCFSEAIGLGKLVAAELNNYGIRDVHKDCGMMWLLLSELEYLQKAKDKSAWHPEKQSISVVILKLFFFLVVARLISQIIRNKI